MLEAGFTYTTANRRIGQNWDVMLGTSFGNPVSEDVDGEHAQLDLDGNDLGDLGGLVDGLGTALGEVDATDLTRVDVLLLDDAKGLLERDIGVSPRAGKGVNLLSSTELADDVVKRSSDALGCAVGHVVVEIVTALDGEEDLVGILGILGEVVLEKCHGVVLGSAVELGAVPDVASVFEGSAHGLDSLVQRGRSRTPRETCGLSVEMPCELSTVSSYP